MNTQLAFAFGMLAMVTIIMIIVLVVGMVKVIRHEAGFRNMYKEINDCHRHISDTERNIYSEINETQNRFGQHIDELKKELQAYTDSRIDKALGTTGSKQILKN